jgi:dTDP-4-amino-4,6-dideoxygalactose transaminase
LSDNRTVPFFRPSISENEIEEVSDSLRSGWLTTGPKTNQFEKEIAFFVGAKYAVALNSCTAALHLALEAIGIMRGDLVIVPTMTFAATAEIVRYFDATPVFVDCDSTLCMDTISLAKTIEAIRSKKPISGINPPYGQLKAIIPVHYGGYACDMNAIMNIANEYGIDVIEDCAHTLPSFFRSKESEGFLHAGRFGRVGCFSFYANKCITTGEGGMAVTDDESLAQRIRIMSLHGLNNDAWKRFTKQGSWFYEIIAPGFKYNMTDVAAAIGIHQLKRAEEFRVRRQIIAQRYTEKFRQINEIEPPPDDFVNRIHSWHLYSLRLNLDLLTIDRTIFIDKLKELGVSCSVHWMPLHLHQYYRQTFGLGEGLFPVAEYEWRRLVSLPIYPSMTDHEVDYVIEVVSKTIQRFAR